MKQAWMGLRIKDGRGFSRQFASDSNGVIFNETAIAMMKLKDPIGKTITLWGRPAQVIGNGLMDSPTG